MRLQTVQSSFADGQISPRLQGMVELESYRSSLASIQNMVCLPQGSVTRRPGTYYVCSTKNDAYVRLIPFSRGQGTSAVLEFGAGYIRFYSNDGQVTKSGSTYELTTIYIDGSSSDPAIPFTANDIDDISFTQSADVLFLAHPAYPPLKLSRFAVDDWKLEYLTFNNGPFQSVNTTDTTLTLALTGSSALQYEEIGEVSPSACDQTTDTITLNNHPFVNGQTIRVSVINSGTWASLTISGTPQNTFQVSTATQNTFKLKYAGNAVPFTNDPTDSVRLEKPYIPKDATVSVTASATTGINDDVGFINAGGISDVNRYIRINSETAPQIKWGYVKITTVTSSTVVQATVIEDLANVGATTEYAMGAFSQYTGYPRAIQIYQQRLVLAGTAKEPQTVFFSKTADFTNFSTSEPLGQSTGNIDSAGRSIIGEQIFEDNALSLTISSDTVDQIEWLSEDRRLTVGTSGGIFQIYGSDDDVTATPFNFSIIKASAWAADSTSLPVKIGNNLLYVQRNGRKLRELAFDKVQDQYAAADLSLRAEDVTQSGIIEMAYQDQPYSIVWCIRADGKIAAMTYVDLLQMHSWSLHTIGGTHTDASLGNHAKVETISVIPRGTYDQVYMVVKRTINSQTKRYVEFFERFYDSFYINAENAHFVDSGLEEPSTRSAASTSITGLSHLEAETVQILGDAAVQPDRTVASGNITLQLAAHKFRVGLAFTSIIQTLPVVSITDTGNSIGNRKRIHQATLRLFESMGFKFGNTVTNLDEAVFRLASDEMGQALEYFTGEKTFQIADEFSTEAQLVIQQDTPYPITVLLIGIDYETNE